MIVVNDCAIPKTMSYPRKRRTLFVLVFGALSAEFSPPSHSSVSKPLTLTACAAAKARRGSFLEPLGAANVPETLELDDLDASPVQESMKQCGDEDSGGEAKKKVRCCPSHVKRARKAAKKEAARMRGVLERPVMGLAYFARKTDWPIS